MTLRIATWNMNHGFRSPEERQAAWGLLAEHNLDFALLQEALPTNAPGKRAVYKPGGISSSRPWGSAVISFGRELKELSELTTRHSRRAVSLYQTAPGSVAVAYVPDIKLTLVSVYGVIEARRQKSCWTSGSQRPDPGALPRWDPELSVPMQN